MKKTALTILGFVALLQGCNKDVNEYQSSWEHQALSLQYELDKAEPLVRNSFLGTHNSYNASAYTTALSYIDPNQTHSINNQLQMDIRALELDVHSFVGYDQTSKSFYKDIKLCHGRGNHLGCSPWDRSFASGLEEISDWLSNESNQDQVLLIYIEDHINDSDYEEATALIDSYLGQYIYKPNDTGCDYIDSDVTKQQVLSAGKNLVIVSDGCSNSTFNQLVFGGFENGPGGYPTSSVDTLLASNDCISDDYDQEEVLELFVRVQEARTKLSNLVGAAGEKVTPEIVADLAKCEVNLIGMDKLTPFDGRLKAAVWSWEENQPGENQGNCALQNVAGRFVAEECNLERSFACKELASGEWRVSTIEGNWEQGDLACEGLDMTFATPTSSYDNENLIKAKLQAGVTEIWLNYNKHSEDTWISNPTF